ncbi:MAG: alpha/beta hydrolase [Tidjanibacter sp.]|nr:alpha/beta hydrolase [Tidjanibacter sp.]
MKKFMKILLIALGSILGLGVVLVLLFFVLFAHGMEKQSRESGFYEEWSAKDGIKVENVVYGDNERHRLDIYYPSEGPTENAGLILFIHGGSWLGGDKADRDDECHRLTKQGYITATMNYRLLGKSYEASIQAMLDDIAAAIATIKSEAAARGYNISQMAISGQSAGAHLAMLFALKSPERSVVPIKFVVSMVGPADLSNVLGVDVDALTDEQVIESGQLLQTLSGVAADAGSVTRESIAESLADYSPITFVDTESVPLLGAYGGKDPIVRKYNYDVLKEAYETAGVEHTLFLFPEADHSLYGAPELTAEYYKEFFKFAKTYFGY